MSSNQLPKLAAAEMPIMAVIWDRGPLAVREVVAEVNAERAEPVARNTVLKQMQRLEEKGWLRREGEWRNASIGMLGQCGTAGGDWAQLNVADFFAVDFSYLVAISIPRVSRADRCLLPGVGSSFLSAARGNDHV